jgi:ABC-type amino acid transport substrate-binding protein
VVTMFGSMNVAMPFLLDAMRVPVDTFQLFVATSVINSRFGTLVAAMHTVAMAIIGTCAATGRLRYEWRPLVRYALKTFVLAALVVAGVRLAGGALASPVEAHDVLGAMSVDRKADATNVAAGLTPEPQAAAPAGERLRLITARRSMRVCYLSDALPYAYLNAADDLVGYDVAAMHRLALELGIRLAFIPIERALTTDPTGARTYLQNGTCDLLVGGVAVTTRRAAVMQFSASYLDETVAFVVPDADRARFDSWEAIARLGRITVAVPNTPYYLEKLAALLPQAVIVPIDSLADVFSTQKADAIAMPAERGSAWTLRYPQYSVVVPLPNPIHIPLAFGMPAGEPELAGFIDAWVALKRRDGTLDELYQYWILGRNAVSTPPRWSIIRDVLHWVD